MITLKITVSHERKKQRERQVEVEKPRGHKLGIDVMLMTAGGRCGLLVGQARRGVGWLG